MAESPKTRRSTSARSSKSTGPKKAPTKTAKSAPAPAPGSVESDESESTAPAPRSRRHLTGEDKLIRNFALEAARLLDDRHFTDVLMLDVRGKSDLTDYIILGSGTSDRQIRSVADEIARLGAESGMARMGTEQDGPAMWVVVDFVDVIVHLFEPATRAHYDIEMLWGDAPRASWKRRAKK